MTKNTYSLIVAFPGKITEQDLFQSLRVGFKVLPNGFGSTIIHQIKEYIFPHLEEYRGLKHSQKRAEILREQGYKLYEMNLDDDDGDWVSCLLYQTSIDIKTSRMELWTYQLGTED